MLLSLVSLCFSVLSLGAESLTLAKAIELSMSLNQELVAQRIQQKQAEQDIYRVEGEFGPKFEAIGGIGPITKATGSATSSVEDKSSIGRMLIGKFSLTQPLFTWGRKGNYTNAAKAGLTVKEAESTQKENDVRFSVKEAYHGYQMANSFRDFIEGGKSELQKALQGRNKKGGKTDYRMEIFLAEVENKEAEVLKHVKVALEGFALRVGVDRETILPKEVWLVPRMRTKKSLEEYIEMAKAERPEFRQLREGIFAKRSLGRAETKALWPVLVFLASYDLADTNVRPQQPGVFSYDPYNRDTYTLGLGFKLDFQWTLQKAKASRHYAEAEELEAKQAFALRGIEIQVRKAYYELEEAEARLAASKKSYQAGKQWLTSAAIGYGAGLSGSQAMVDAYGARAETTKNYFEAVFRYHMAWASLSQSVGTEVDPEISKL